MSAFAPLTKIHPRYHSIYRGCLRARLHRATHPPIPHSTRIRETINRGGKEVNCISTQHQHSVNPKPQAPVQRVVFPNRIALYRRVLQHGSITQDQLADAVGITSREVRRIESGTVIPSGTVLVRIARALHASTSELVEDPAPASGSRASYDRKESQRVLALGVTARRCALLCLDSDFVIVDATSIYLRHVSTLRSKTRRIAEKLLEVRDRLNPRHVLVEDGFEPSRRDLARKIAEGAARALAQSGLEPRRMTFRSASLSIAGQPNPRRCAAVLAGQYDVLAARLRASHKLRSSTDDRIRDERPLLAALALAHATVLEEFLLPG